MKKATTLVLILSLLILAGCSSKLIKKEDTPYEILQETVDQHTNSLFMKGASWSLMAVDLKKGRVILKRDEDRSLIPASNMKLLTSGCALEILGPDFRIATQIGYTGEIDAEGILHGDLIVIGSGDPTIGTRYDYRNTGIDFRLPAETFLGWGDSLSRKGITGIDGNIVGCGAFRTEHLFGAGWEWDDLRYWYGAEITSLIYTDNSLEVTISPGDTTDLPASLTWHPPTDLVSFFGLVNTTDASHSPNIKYKRGLQDNIFSLTGAIPDDSSPTRQWLAVYGAETYFLTELKNTLVDADIMVSGSCAFEPFKWRESKTFKPLFTHYSPPLKDLIKVINTQSQNLYAETLIRNLGFQQKQVDSVLAANYNDAFEAGRAVIKEWESSMVGKSTGFALVDGSGMSRRNLLSASEIIKVLVHQNRSLYRDEFVASLAVPGTGTLRHRFFGMPEGITLHAKSGSMARVRSLSGYLATENGPRIAFALLCNNYLCDSLEVEAAMENITQVLALYLMQTM
ncbi:D-alanyl-D-alanine carboxypeptidase/D-alanyl-D-alanine-endopeptidase [bacterium]|nr:D-alanyl-D-alanine carboxypeptidase/D-alanyl-D-alanine-endopeptidase [bacterium]MBU1652905.1 D-alanyl-D-alanine carboxypeptidase/D-alanyl-D-alanine-endopeptidase [bacterium]